MATPAILGECVGLTKSFIENIEVEAEMISSIVTLLQIMFVKLRGYDTVKQLVPPFLELVATNRHIILAHDVIAAFVTVDPIRTLSSEAMLQIWLSRENTRPAAFLMSSISVIQAWGQLPGFVRANEELIQQERYVRRTLLEQICRCDGIEVEREDPDIFNFAELISVTQ